MAAGETARQMSLDGTFLTRKNEKFRRIFIEKLFQQRNSIVKRSEWEKPWKLRNASRKIPVEWLLRIGIGIDISQVLNCQQIRLNIDHGEYENVYEKCASEQFDVIDIFPSSTKFTESIGDSSRRRYDVNTRNAR